MSRFLSGVKTADHGRTVCLNQLLHVAGRQSRSLDGVVSVLREVLDAQFNDETYEILLGAYAPLAAREPAEDIVGSS